MIERAEEMAGTQLAQATGSDASGIVRVVQHGLPPDFLPLTIYGADGVENYVREHIKGGALMTNTRFFVGRSKQKVVAAIEIQLRQDAIFINQVTVAPDYRRHGLARELLRFSLMSVDAETSLEVMLDVLDTNQSVKAWYERLGFQPSHSTDWCEIPTLDTAPSDCVRIIGLPLSQLGQEHFGFSQLILECGDQTHTIGRVGHDWYRLTSPESINDVALLRFLSWLEPHRRFIALVPRHNAYPAAATTRLVSHRMHAKLDDVLTTLSAT